MTTTTSKEGQMDIFENRLQACFLRLMPVVDLDVDPPVKHIRSHENLPIGDELDEAMKILTEAREHWKSQGAAEERERAALLLTKEVDPTIMLEGWEKYWIKAPNGRYVEKCMECENSSRILKALSQEPVGEIDGEKMFRKDTPEEFSHIMNERHL